MAQFITGDAGTGKTTMVRNSGGLLTATTGAASVNLECSTINSTLGFSKIESLRSKSRNGILRQNVRNLKTKYAFTENQLIIDEASMLEAEQLDLIHNAVQRGSFGEMGITLVGDFAQLPPVSGQFAFEAGCWPEYERNITKLTKIHRQDDPKFLEALNMIRRGNKDGAQALKEAGAEFSEKLDPDFRGVTLCPRNSEADDLNDTRLNLHKGLMGTFGLTAKGEPEENRLIPTSVMLKVGVRVMITCNDTPDFDYANGDCGIITHLDKTHCMVQLDRTGQEVYVGHHTRKTFDYRYNPAQWKGEIVWMPVKVAYAVTIHKAQGLTLDAAQIKATADWPNLMYVACSRVRKASHLRIVGTVDKLARSIVVHPKVTRWL